MSSLQGASQASFTGNVNNSQNEVTSLVGQEVRITGSAEPSSTASSRARLLSQGRVKYSSSAAEIEDICRELLQRGVTETGWDIEWRTTYKTGEAPRKTALMQICYQLPRGSYCCLLFHVFFSGLPPSLRQLLESPVSLYCPAKISMYARHLNYSRHLW